MATRDLRLSTREFGLDLPSTSIRLLVTSDCLGELHFEGIDFVLQLLLLFRTLLQRLSELDDLVLQPVGDLFELGDGAGLGLKCLELLARQPSANTRLDEDNAANILPV